MTVGLALLPARVAPERIAYVKFILEGYDGLAILTTTDRTNGEIALRYYPARQDELLPLLDELQVGYQFPVDLQAKILL
jgi:hypothetical protein